MPMRMSRRTFVRSLGYAGATAPLFMPRLVRAVSAKVRHVSFGSAGMAWADVQSMASHPAFDLYAVCEVDAARLGPLKEKFPQARVYSDWRVLLDKEEKNFDSANVSTPDHMHAPVSMSLLHRGKHVYTQKPLTHDVYESRQLRLAARSAGVVTQMGIQGHSMLEYRLAVELVRSGAIGKVKDVHSWSHKNWGGGQRPGHTDPVPAGFDWDLWIGTAPMRPFAKGVYHPSDWRRWLDFGTGTFGDMGCHIYDPVYKATGVTSPLTITSSGPVPFQETWPEQAQVHYTFPGTAFTTDPVSITWYDGGLMPPKHVLDLFEGVQAPAQGSVCIGTEGVMLIPHIAAPRLYPTEKFKGFKYPKLEPMDHYHQFVNACRGEGKTLASFEYAGPLTEAILLGGVAVRFPHEELKWDAENLRFTNHAQAGTFLRREYRKGWEVQGLS